MLEPVQQADVPARLHHFPVVALLGARQVGKTTLSHQVGAACDLADGIHFKLREGMNDWGGDPPAAAGSTDGVKGVDAVVLSPGDGDNLAEGGCARSQKSEAIEAPWSDGDPSEDSVYWGVFVGDLNSGPRETRCPRRDRLGGHPPADTGPAPTHASRRGSGPSARSATDEAV